MPESEGETLRLKTLHVDALTDRRREIKLDLNWKLPPCCLAFVVAEGTMRSAGEEQSPTFPLGYRPFMLKHQQAWQDVMACAIVAGLCQVRPTAFQLDLSPTPQDRVHV